MQELCNHKHTLRNSGELQLRTVDASGGKNVYCVPLQTDKLSVPKRRKSLCPPI